MISVQDMQSTVALLNGGHANNATRLKSTLARVRQRAKSGKMSLLLFGGCGAATCCRMRSRAPSGKASICSMIQHIARAKSVDDGPRHTVLHQLN